MYSRMGNLANDAKFTLMYEQVTGLMVLLQHHIGVIPRPKWYREVNDNTGKLYKHDFFQ